MSESLQSRLLKFLTLLALLATLVTASLSVFTAYLRERADTSASLTTYMNERGRREERMFNILERVQHAANKTFWQHFDNLTDERVNELLEQSFPAAADGTRRSADDLFTGTYMEGFGPIAGIGGFMSGLNEQSPDRRRSIVAAFLTISALSPTIDGHLESLWFITPTDDLVVFAPHREDRLLFYRKTAPPDFRVSVAPFMDTSSFELNPNGVTRCTPLTRLMYVETGEALTTGCQTPVRRDGRQYGIWGTTLPLSNAFRAALQDLPDNEADVFYVSAKGELIAHRDLLSGEHVLRTQVDAIEANIQPKAISQEAQAKNLKSGPLPSDSHRIFSDLDVVYHLEIPDWYFAVRMPKEAIFFNALKNVSGGFFTTLTVILVSISALGYAVRRDGIIPLNSMARRFSSGEKFTLSDARADTVDFETIQKRGDEVGHLARTLNDYQTRMENYTSELEDKIAERTEELDAANQAKGRFLATISHELRTPMNGILGIAGALQKTELAEEQSEMAELISNSAEILERQLTDILDVSKIEAGRLSLSSEPINIADTVKAALDFYAPACREKQIQLRTDLSADTHDWFIGDAVRIRQIVSNLTSNAIKFTEHGHVTVSLRRDNTFARAKSDSTVHFILTVQDTGIGMSKDVAEDIFSPFRQADSSTFQKYGGSGLGLSICKSLLELMDGSIEVASEPGHGTTFTCKFRMKRCETRPESIANEPDELVLQQTPKILLAEDHLVNRHVIELILTPLGFEIQAVEDGQKAVDAAETEAFQLILMDIQMPEKDGLTAISEIRQIETRDGRRASKIITLSANTSDKDIEKSLTAGADLHLSKPITPDRLINAISSMLTYDDKVNASLDGASL